MKFLLIVSLVTGSVFAANCPTGTLIKKAGANTHYASDFKTKWTTKELAKFGCTPDSRVMSKEQQLSLLNAEYEKKKNSL